MDESVETLSYISARHRLAEGILRSRLAPRESYKQKWTYVLENPVRAGLVKEACEWRYQGEIYRLDLNL